MTVYVTFNVAQAGIVLSNGNLTATSTAGSLAAGSTQFNSAGKYYIEATLDVCAASFTQLDVGDAARVTAGGSNYIGVVQTGNIYIGGTIVGSVGSAFSNGNLACLAIDFTNKRAWFRKGAAGLWNNSGTADPATNTGGIDLTSLLATAPALSPCIYVNTTSDQVTLNAGATAFAGTVPSGFTAGWPNTSSDIRASKLNNYIVLENEGIWASKLNSYAVLTNLQMQVSKINTYIVLSTPSANTANGAALLIGL